jgi:hypothetical protein
VCTLLVSLGAPIERCESLFWFSIMPETLCFPVLVVATVVTLEVGVFYTQGYLSSRGYRCCTCSCTIGAPRQITTCLGGSLTLIRIPVDPGCGIKAP